jgi:5,10-methylenetetrahydrofolate reductase
MAKYMNEFVPGIIIGQDVIDELSAVEKGKGLQKGIEIAARMIRTIKEEKICHGVHIMAVGNEKIVPEIIETAEIASVRT